MKFMIVDVSKYLTRDLSIVTTDTDVCCKNITNKQFLMRNIIFHINNTSRALSTFYKN